MGTCNPRSAAAIREAIGVFGGQPRMAIALDVSQPTISEWANGKRPVPTERCPDIERETRKRGRAIPCERIRPDVDWATVRGHRVEAV